jgi:hypothetical protein
MNLILDMYDLNLICERTSVVRYFLTRCKPLLAVQLVTVGLSFYTCHPFLLRYSMT